MTLMCNFFDESNRDGLAHMFYANYAKALDAAKRDARGRAAAEGRAATLPRAAAAPGAPTRELPAAAAATYRVAHAPFVYLRAAPDTEAEMVGIALHGEALAFGAERDGWLRTARPVDRDGRHGWALRDGARLRLGALLVPCET